MRSSFQRAFRHSKSCLLGGASGSELKSIETLQQAQQNQRSIQATFFAPFAAWAPPRQYPFKPPLNRIKVGGKYMQNPAVPKQPVLPNSRQLTSPKGKQRVQTQSTLHVPLQPGAAKLARIQIGRRLGQPNLQRIARVRAKPTALASTEDKPALVKQDIWEEDALSHTAGLQLIFLGTGTGHPAEQRRTGAVAMRLSRSTWLFDCGEDTQRQVHKQPLIRHGKLERIFITNRRSSNIFGLPGMLCTMSAARDIGLDLADVPLHVYGPPGLAEFIRPLLQLSDTFISMPVIVHEFVDHAVNPEQIENPQCLDRRSCLYRVLLPPDKLNPKGYYNGEIVPFLSRATWSTNQMAKGRDERATSRQLNLPPPGNPDAVIEGPHELRWTIKADEDTVVTAAPIPAAVRSWAYVMQEADRVGKLFVDRAVELRVQPGSDYTKLKQGKSVYNADGVLIHPEQVVGPDIQGRKVAVIGESTDSSPLEELIQGADAIVHSASCEEGMTANGMLDVRTTIDMASAFGKAVDAKHVVLYRFKPSRQSEGLSKAVAVVDSRMENENSAKPTNSPDSNGSNSSGSAFDELNTLSRLSWEKKPAFGGYLGKSPNNWKPMESPPQVVRAAEELAGSIFGKQQRVTVAEDMDLYAIERRTAESPAFSVPQDPVSERVAV